MKKLDIINNYYKPKLNNETEDYKILGWESREAQFQRFQILTDNVDLEGKKILDVGCGLGNLLDHLKDVHKEPNYLGVDILPEMIKLASINHDEKYFYHMDIFAGHPFPQNHFHTIYSSGIFNINMGNNHDFLKDSIKLFLNLAKKHIVFNLLHHHSPDRDDSYYYFVPDEVIKMIEEIGDESIKSIKIVEHYLKNDFTIIVEKD